MFEKVTNPMQKRSFIKNVRDIAAATQDTTKGYLAVKNETLTKIHTADNTLLAPFTGTLAAPVADGFTATIATAVGIAAVAAEPAAEAKTSVVHVAGDFEVETGIELTPINRGAGKTDIYPFDKLTAPGMSFFVPATEAMPNPGKALGTIVSAKTRAGKLLNPQLVYTIRANVHKVLSDLSSPKGARVYRIAPETVTAQQPNGSIEQPAQATTAPVAAFPGTATA